MLYQYVRSRPYRKTVVKYRKNRITVEIADSLAKGAVGLMYREKIKSKEGMLFAFPYEHPWEIWMLNMRFPLDIIWMDKSRNVVYLERNLQPCKSFFACKSYAPKKGAKYVLEIAAGAAAKMGIKPGDRLVF